MAYNPELIKFEPRDFPLSNEAIQYQKANRNIKPFEKVCDIRGVYPSQFLVVIDKFLSPNRQDIHYFCQTVFDDNTIKANEKVYCY